MFLKAAILFTTTRIMALWRLQRCSSMIYQSFRFSTPPPFPSRYLLSLVEYSQPMTNSFVSVPADLGQLNCAALVAGVIAGVLDGASFVSVFPATIV